MSKQNYQKDKDLKYVQKPITTPAFVVPSPGVPTLYEDNAPSKFQIPAGEAPYSDGTIVNIMDNATRTRSPGTVDSPNYEVLNPMLIEVNNLVVRPAGAELKYNENADLPEQYTFNKVVRQMNYSAMAAEQTLQMKQLTELSYFKQYRVPGRTSISRFVISGLAVAMTTASFSKFFFKLPRGFAFIKEMMTVDPSRYNEWSNLATRFKSARFFNAYALLISDAANMVVDTRMISAIKDMMKLRKTSKGMNGYFTVVNPTLDESMGDALALDVTVGAVDTNLKGDNESMVKVYGSFEELSAIFFNVSDLLKVAAGTPFDITLPGNYLAWSGQGTIKVTDYKSYLDAMTLVMMAAQEILQMVVDRNIAYYSALDIVAQAGMITDNFRRGYNLTQDLLDLMNIEYSTTILELLTVASSANTINMKNDNLNNVTITVPTVKGVIPFNIYRTSGILKFLNTNEGYLPWMDWLNIQFGSTVYLWAYDDTDSGHMEITIESTSELANTNPIYSDFKTIDEIANWNVMRILGQWMVSYQYKIAKSRPSGDAAADSFVLPMKSASITNYVPMSYPSMAMWIINRAPIGIGLKIVAPVTLQG